MHRKPKTHRGLKRVGVGVAIFAIPAVAIAGVLFVLGLQGSLTLGDATVSYVEEPVTIDAGNCTGTVLNEQAMSIGWTDPWAGDTCTMSFDVKDGGASVDMRLQRVVLDPALTGTLGLSCGTTVTVGDLTTPTVTLTIEIDPGASFGQLITFFGNGEGLEWVDSASFIPGNCT